MASVPLFRLFGIGVRVDRSWIVIAALVTWSLSTGLFPSRFRGEPTALYWVMGLLGSMGLFLSIIFHEMSHSLLARRFGIEIRGITLFIFGGVAEMAGEPKEPKAELLVAGIGPVSSAFLAVMAGLGFTVLGPDGPVLLVGILWYLAMINMVLAVFNMVPAFPLDGGRVLRAILWWQGKSLVRATSITSRIGAGFGILMMVLGAYSIFRGNFIGGMWWILIGLFLRGAAQRADRDNRIQGALEGIPVERFLIRDPVTMPPSDTVSPDEVTISIDADALEALNRLREAGVARLTVVDGTRPVGILTLEDLARYLTVAHDRG